MNPRLPILVALPFIATRNIAGAMTPAGHTLFTFPLQPVDRRPRAGGGLEADRFPPLSAGSPERDVLTRGTDRRLRRRRSTGIDPSGGRPTLLHGLPVRGGVRRRRLADTGPVACPAACMAA